MISGAVPFFAFLVGFAPTLSIAAAGAALAGLALSTVAGALSKKNAFTPAPTPMDRPVLAFLTAWLLASLLGLDPAGSLRSFSTQARFAVFYLLLWTDGGRHRGTALKGYLWGAGVATAYGLAQWAVSAAELWTKFPALFAFLNGGDRCYAALRAGRAHGAVHPLTYAEVLLPAFLFTQTFLLEADTPKRRAAGFLAFLASAVTLLLTLSRGPWLGAVLGTGVVLALHPRRMRLFLPVLCLAAAFMLQPDLRHRALSIARSGKADSRPLDTSVRSAGHRLILWHNARQVARRHPVFGAGPKQLAPAIKRLGADPDLLPNPDGKDGDAHSQYLQYLSERGAAGLAAFLWLLAAAVAAAARRWREARASPPADIPSRAAPLALLAYFLAFPVMNLTERVFDDGEPVLVFWALAAFACGKRTSHDA